MKANPVEETKKRSKILNTFVSFIQEKSIPVEYLRVAGSMAYGENYSVNSDSDIDIDLFVYPKNFYLLNPLLKLINAEKIFLEAQVSQFEKVSLIASYGKFDNVIINFWIINLNTISQINDLSCSYFSYYTKTKVEPFKEYIAFKSNNIVKLPRDYEPFLDGYLSKRYCSHENSLLSENYVINNLFIAKPILNYPLGNKMTDQMWQSFSKLYPNIILDDVLKFLPPKIIPRLSDKFMKRVNELLLTNTT